MLRLSVITLALVAWAVVALAAPVPPAARKPVLFFPTAVGAKWVYRTWDETEYEQEVTAVEWKGDDAVVTVGSVIDGRMTPYKKVLVSPGGLFEGPGGLDEVKFPHRLLKIPARIDDTWDRLRGGRAVTHTVIGVGEAEVEVPAGTFQAVKVRWESPARPGPVDHHTDYFAPGVGVVKSVTVMIGGRKRVRLLTAFTPGKN